ncbi:hypothetical protein [Gracilimonas amylolytica]|uniref:hypothetical protein n=1 Tax=Gracilimonas amylolytica TaxID=1749045 RepID=UPI00130010CF|nr:hypothetical protein [Gracilimonas amylolytica]
MKRKERNHTVDKFCTSNFREGTLISFSGMKTILALFFSALTFCYFWVKPKVRGMAEGIFTCNQAGLRILACNDQTDLGNQL